jgi:hypothetical protein
MDFSLCYNIYFLNRTMYNDMGFTNNINATIIPKKAWKCPCVKSTGNRLTVRMQLFVKTHTNELPHKHSLGLLCFRLGISESFWE